MINTYKFVYTMNILLRKDLNFKCKANDENQSSQTMYRVQKV